MKKSEVNSALGVLTRHAVPYVNTLLYASEDTQGYFLVGVIVKHAQTCLTASSRRHEATHK